MASRRRGEPPSAASSFGLASSPSPSPPRPRTTHPVVRGLFFSAGFRGSPAIPFQAQNFDSERENGVSGWISGARARRRRLSKNPLGERRAGDCPMSHDKSQREQMRNDLRELAKLAKPDAAPPSHRSEE